MSIVSFCKPLSLSQSSLWPRSSWIRCGIHCSRFENSKSRKMSTFSLLSLTIFLSKHFLQSALTGSGKASTCTWFIVGGFNARHMQWDPGTTNTAGTQMYKFLQDHALTQCLTSPTRYSTGRTSSSVLDLFITNLPDLVDRHDISDPLSDHCCISTTLRTKLQASNPELSRSWLEWTTNEITKPLIITRYTRDWWR